MYLYREPGRCHRPFANATGLAPCASGKSRQQPKPAQRTRTQAGNLKRDTAESREQDDPKAPRHAVHMPGQSHTGFVHARRLTPSSAATRQASAIVG